MQLPGYKGFNNNKSGGISGEMLADLRNTWTSSFSLNLNNLVSLEESCTFVQRVTCNPQTTDEFHSYLTKRVFLVGSILAGYILVGSSAACLNFSKWEHQPFVNVS